MNQYGLALPALGGRALWLGWPLWRAGDGGAAGRRLGGFVAGGVLGGLPLLVYNTLVFGNPTSSGYKQNAADIFTVPPLEGLNGLLLSPGKGLWLYAPPVLLGLIGLIPFARRRPTLALTLAGVILPPLALFSVYRFWPGDGSWGPRYLLPLLPFALLPAVALLPRADAPPVPLRAWSPGQRLLALLIAGLGLAGLAVNTLGAAVNFDTYINLVNDDNMRYWNATYSPVRGHWTVLTQRLGDALAPADGVARLTAGWSYSEGDKYRGELFPRWTTGAATLTLPPGAPALTLHARLADHRPPDLPRAPITVTLAGAEVAAIRDPVAGSPIETTLTAALPVPPSGAAPSLVLNSPTWNPKRAGAGERNEDIGLLVESLSLTNAAGQPLRLVEQSPIQPYYPAQRWYYDPQSLHLVDHWAWYAAASALPRRITWPLAALVLLAGLGSVAWGAWRFKRLSPV
jgi:hypothetical protein